MSHAVPALGIAVLCASGWVWYLPAAADVRAGADRPLSSRLSAAATLTGWGTAALVAALLLTPVPWSAIAAWAAVGAAAAVCLATRARVQHVHEEKEEAERWKALRYDVRPGLPGPQRAFVCWLLVGVTLATGTALAVLYAGGAVPAVVAAVAVAGLSLAFASTRAHRVRRRALR
ncbi:hypothetical protein ABZZ20_21125 [Streptomyces sp. NPDC006430]|uniref:hypothetical protein n=1 Tax=Streptomyces sp. NPDC006430 TaxID=3154299 RepID=UPI0033B08BEA